MAAKLHRFRSKADKLNEDQRVRLRQLLLSDPDLPREPVRQLVAVVDRQTAARKGWTFVMMSPADNAKVVSWLAKNSEKPMVAVQLWAILFLHLDHDTGEVVQSRDELAGAVDTSPRDVSRIMTELETIGAISRKREKVAGMRGPGVARYFMSPRIGTHIGGKAREIAQREAPVLRLVGD
ncbi:MAG: hypothetical protein EON48_06280 [Acetobacteraceae bacterium]|nr:MAG: hypothetical protein EON48_06280 [Acetobacteraceae bacterium]